MTELSREYAIELSVRGGEGASERIIEGVVIPFGEVADVRDPGGPAYRETIAPGAVDGLDASRVMLEAMVSPATGPENTHAGARLVGRGVSAEPRTLADGRQVLWMAHRVARTPAGDEALALASEGILGSLSVSFRPVAERRRADGVIERTAIDVRRVALVQTGAYRGAQVTAVRAATEDDMPETTAPNAETNPPEPEPEPTPDPTPEPGVRPNRTRVTVDVERASAERAAVAELTRGAGGGVRGSYVTRPEMVYGPTTGHSYLSDGWKASRGDREAAERQWRHGQFVQDIAENVERAYAFDPMGELQRSHGSGLLSRASDVVSTEIPGAYPNEYVPTLLTPRILKGRPMGDFYDRFPIANALPRIYPKVTTSTTVVVQSAEGAALGGTDFATTAQTVNPLIYGAFTDVSRQVLDGADPTANAMLMQDLLEAYAQASETVIKTAVEAGSTASGVAITAATPYAGVLANVINYYVTRFKGATGAFIPSAEFSVLGSQADTTGRPLLPMIGAMNSDGVTLADDLSLDFAILTARGKLSYASTVNVNVFGRPNDFVIFESSVASFSYDQPVGPQAVRVGIWAYLAVGTRLGSLKVTAA